MLKKVLLSLAFAPLVIQSYAGTASAFSSIQTNSSTIHQYEKFEITFNLSGTNALSFDYDSILVQAVLTTPNGQNKTIDGFLYNNTGGNAIWKIRFTPTEVGTWNYYLKAKNSISTTITTSNSFSCTSAIKNGFVRKTNTNYLAFDNGKSFIPIGQNLAWEENRDMKKYFSMLGKMNDQGCNAIRYFIAPWFNEIEWTPTPKVPYNYQGIKNYYLPNALKTDSVLDSLASRNMYAQISLFQNSNVATDTFVVDTFVFGGQWLYNPYNINHGGTCNNHHQFFTDSIARHNYKNKLRYINARWGYSPNILALEIGNEMELSVSYYNGEYDTTKQIIADWVDEMTQYLKTMDVNNHLRSVSYAYANNGKQNLSNPNIDITQIHEYNQDRPVANFENVIVGSFLEHNSQYKKPFMVAEYGLYYDDNGYKSLADDPSGVLIHNALWSSMFSGSYGPALNWWWDTYIDTANLYSSYKPISKVIPKVPFLQKNMRLAKAKNNATVASTCFMIPQHWQWEKAPDSVFTIDSRGVFYPDNLSLSNYLFGQNWFPDIASPLIIKSNYQNAGQFKIHTGDKGTNPNITMYVDSVQKLSVNDAQSDSIYSIELAAGKHDIRIENKGDGQINIDSLEFINYQVPVRIFALQSEDSTEIDAYLLNGDYNWQYLRDHSQTPPPSLTNQTVIFENTKNGNYQIEWYNCISGDIEKTDTVESINNQLQILIPTLLWDAFLKIEKIELTSGIHSLSERNTKIYPNPFKNEITIERANNETATLDIENILGEKVFSTNIISSKEKISVPNFPSGIYIVTISEKSVNKIMKMIKE